MLARSVTPLAVARRAPSLRRASANALPPAHAVRTNGAAREATMQGKAGIEPAVPWPALWGKWLRHLT
jgi:hypothetical protein